MNHLSEQQVQASSPLDRTHSDWKRRQRKRRLIFWIFGCGPFIILCVLCAGVPFGFYDTPLRHRGVTDPQGRFEEKTQLSWPSNSRVIAADDSHWDGSSGPVLAFGPGLLDGEMHVIFDADPADLKTWLENAAPWGSTWNDGPVPEYILSKTEFPIEVKSSSIKYATRERVGPQKRSPGFEFWDGELIVIDLEHGRVWLSSWDM